MSPSPSPASERHLTCLKLTPHWGSTRVLLVSQLKLKHFVPALLLSLLVSGFSPGPVLAATAPTPLSSGDASHPLVMQQAAAAVATAPTGPLLPSKPGPQMAAVGGAGTGPQREVFGFALLSSLADPTIGYPSWNFSLLSTVAVFGLHVQDDGYIANDSGWSVWSSSQMDGLLTTAHASGVKVVATIILQDFSVGTPHMCAGLANRAITIAQTVSIVANRHADGVNIDYEGLNGNVCPNGQTPRAMMTALVTEMRGQLAAATPYLSVDTYASSAGDPAGFFDVAGMNPYVDSFFVMAYDSDYSNFNQPPLNCARYCLNPVSPLTGYFYNDTRAASEYSAVVPPSKVILGLPYYGRYGCVTSWAANSYPTTGTNSLTYRASVGIPNDPSNTSYAVHRDATDGVTPWSTWVSSASPACSIESYWDDVISLGQKYDLVNRAGLRGVGLWNLNLGGGAPELWSTLSTYFSCPIIASAPASPATTEFTVSLNAGGCSVASFEVEQYDASLNQGWFAPVTVINSGSTGSAVVDGYPGHSYQFRARAHSSAGVIGSWSMTSTTVASNATYSHPFKGFYVLDGYGGMHAATSPPLSDSTYFGWNIARTAKAWPGANTPQSGFVLDGWGGLHPYGAPAPAGPVETPGGPSHYWAGWDIARDFAFLPSGLGGIVLDGYGGLHGFGVNGNPAPQVQGFTYWGWDIARKVVIFSDNSGGYVLDGYGGLHPFGINGPAPAIGPISGGGYWVGWDIVHDVVLTPGSHSGYLLDGYGGAHPFHAAIDPGNQPPTLQTTYWGWDIARAIWLLPGSATAGYTLDGYGGIHPFGGAPTVISNTYWPGWDIARAVWGA